MNNYALSAINDTLKAELTFCKFLSANDTGQTGGHQAGIYISKPAIPILFSEPGVKGSNKDRWVNVRWQDGSETKTRFIYYGQGTRNEYRITNFSRGFPYLEPEYTGSLFIFIKISEEFYHGYVLSSEDEFNLYLDTFGITPAETNRLIDKSAAKPEVKEKAAFDDFISSLDVDFPCSEEMSLAAREIQNRLYNKIHLIVEAPDKKLIQWTEMEYKLFRAIEHERYGSIMGQGFNDVDDFITLANQVLNRRKSRAGKSLEHHLSAIFTGNNLTFASQAKTEGNKRPDFLFPSEKAYHDNSWPNDKLVTLAAKTTCKDRWRQILNEADRLRHGTKFLCTLQPGITSQQLDEMAQERVQLVVPKDFISYYPKAYQPTIWSLAQFIQHIKIIEDLI